MDREEAESIASRSGWLSKQPAAFRRRVIDAMELRRHAARSLIYDVGDPPSEVYGLVEGELAVLSVSDSRGPTTLHVARPVWWVGEAAVISDTPRRVALVARKESWILHLDRSAIERFAARDSEVWRRFAQITVGHLDHALSVIAGLATGDSRARVARALCRLADLHSKTTASWAVVSVSQQELGEMTRLTRNAIGSILTDLEQAGLVIRRYRRLEIPNLAALLCAANDADSDLPGAAV